MPSIQKININPRALSKFASYCLLSIALTNACTGDDAVEKVTYDDHIKPIFREHCLSCHNANDKKSGLSLDTYTSSVAGGSGGECLVAGDVDSSRLWALTAHVEQPTMPPQQDKIAEPKLALLKKWIEQGLPENSGSVVKKPKVNLAAMGTVSKGRPEGPPPMPESTLKQTPLATEKSAAIAALAASPWSPLVAVGGQYQVSLYHSESGALLGILPFPEGEPQSITFSRDGRAMLVGGGLHSQSGFAVLYDIRTGNRIARVGDELDIVLCADISDDNSKIALAGPQKLVRIYDTASGQLLYELKRHTDWIYAVKFSPDGLLLGTADRSNGLFVWETDTGRFYLDLIGHKSEIRSLCWRPDSSALLSGSIDQTIKLWEMVEGKAIKSWDAHGGGVTAIATCNDGTIVSTGRDRQVKVWDSNGNGLATLPGLAEQGLEVAITVDSKHIVAGDWGGNVRLWERANVASEKVLRANPIKLETRIAVLEQGTETFKTTLAASDAELKLSMTNQIQIQNQIAGYEKAIKETLEKITANAALVAATQTILADLKGKFDAEKNNVTALNVKKDELTKSIAVTRDAGGDVSGGEAELRLVTQQFELASVGVNALEAQINAENGKLASIATEDSSLKAKQQPLETDLAKTKENYQNATNAVAASQQKYDASKVAFDGQLQALEAARNDLISFNNAQALWRLTMEQQKARQLELGNSKLVSKQFIDEKQTAKNQLLEKIAGLKVQVEQLTKQIESEGTTLGGIEKESGAKQIELNELESQIEIAKDIESQSQLLLQSYK